MKKCNNVIIFFIIYLITCSFTVNPVNCVTKQTESIYNPLNLKDGSIIVYESDYCFYPPYGEVHLREEFTIKQINETFYLEIALFIRSNGEFERNITDLYEINLNNYSIYNDNKFLGYFHIFQSPEISNQEINSSIEVYQYSDFSAKGNLTNSDDQFIVENQTKIVDIFSITIYNETSTYPQGEIFIEKNIGLCIAYGVSLMRGLPIWESLQSQSQDDPKANFIVGGFLILAYTNIEFPFFSNNAKDSNNDIYLIIGIIGIVLGGVFFLLRRKSNAN